MLQIQKQEDLRVGIANWEAVSNLTFCIQSRSKPSLGNDRKWAYCTQDTQSTLGDMVTIGLTFEKKSKKLP